MASEVQSPKLEPVPPPPPSSIPQKRVHDEAHSPAVPSPLNPDVRLPEPHSAADDASQSGRGKPSRAKKDSFKKRESKGGVDSGRATPDPKLPKPSEPSNSGPLRYKLAPPKPSDFEPPRGPQLTLHHEVDDANGQSVEFYETSDHVFNKKSFRYMQCIADPLFPSMVYYRQTEPEPYGARMSFEDAATHVFFDRSARQVTTNKGFRMGRANVAVRQGRWYWECKITQGIKRAKDGESKPEGGKHVRMGWARREANLDAPVGFDAYSYGIRDVSGEKVYMSRPKDFFPSGEGIYEGDVIGLEIQLPSERLQRKVMSGHYNPAVDADDEQEPTAEAPNIVRDRVPIRFKAHTYFEKFEYGPTKELEDLMNPASGGYGAEPSDVMYPTHPTPALRTLPNSYIKIYKNGVEVGTPFRQLLGFLPPASKPTPQVGAREGVDDGMLGYYPAVSVFRGGAAEVNFGPDFTYPPPDYTPNKSSNEPGAGAAASSSSSGSGRLRPLCERFQEQVAEDIVYDIIDEVDFWMQDGAGATDKLAVQEQNEAVSITPGRPEIKELVQDD